MNKEQDPLEIPWDLLAVSSLLALQKERQKRGMHLTFLNLCLWLLLIQSRETPVPETRTWTGIFLSHREFFAATGSARLQQEHSFIPCGIKLEGGLEQRGGVTSQAGWCSALFPCQEADVGL